MLTNAAFWPSKVTNSRHNCGTHIPVYMYSLSCKGRAFQILSTRHDILQSFPTDFRFSSGKIDSAIKLIEDYWRTWYSSSLNTRRWARVKAQPKRLTAKKQPLLHTFASTGWLTWLGWFSNWDGSWRAWTTEQSGAEQRAFINWI